LNEIVAAKDLPLHLSDRVFLAYLYARCLDRINDHEGCWKFCDDWLDRIAEVQATNPVPRHNSVELERVRAVTIADGFCIGKMKDGKRMIAPAAFEFFTQIVRDKELRTAGDFCYLARFHEWTEKYEQAYAVLAEAQLLYPEYWEIPFQRAAFRVRTADYQNAINSAQRAAELAPWKTQAWQQLAGILVSSMAKSENSSLRISGDEQFEHMLNSLIGLVESGFDLAVGLESFVRPVMEQ
jgi:tetratricopeptide (TPR) repeat protein